MSDDPHAVPDVSRHGSWREHRAPDIELGSDHALWFIGWRPERDLNPQYDGIPDVPRFGANVEHLKPDGRLCMACIHFDTPEVRAVEEASKRQSEKLGFQYHEYPRWQVHSWEPLTISPSLLCSCGDHGFIREGKWVKA